MKGFVSFSYDRAVLALGAFVRVNFGRANRIAINPHTAVRIG
ncbi:hypothetical protein ACQ0QQ_18145 [Lysinibacillus sphaericus]